MIIKKKFIRKYIYKYVLIIINSISLACIAQQNFMTTITIISQQVDILASLTSTDNKTQAQRNNIYKKINSLLVDLKKNRTLLKEISILNRHIRHLVNTSKPQDIDKLKKIIEKDINNLIRKKNYRRKLRNYTKRITFTELNDKSHKFHQSLNFPLLENRIEKIAGTSQNKQQQIAYQARTTRPIIHSSVMALLKNFLFLKRELGSNQEKKLYQSINEYDFINRLLTKRPLMFMTKNDQYLLRNGQTGYGGFETIGTDKEQAPLILNDYLSYDEMQLAALLGVSVPTFFINNGNRNNNAQPDDPDTFEEKGIFIGLVGARFEKPHYMEWQHMIITPEQNTIANGYGKHNTNNTITPKIKLLNLWSQFYKEPFPTFEEAQNDTSGTYLLLNPTKYLNTSIYKKRMQLVIEPFLIEANEQGKKINKKIYCHVVGLGLGVWQISQKQAELMLDVYADIIRNANLSFITDIDFSWFSSEYTTCGGVGNLELFKTAHNAITIHFSKRNPADKLMGADKNKLLVAMYAWDSNAYPGNEYWIEMLSASGDPAAAACSTISELQNPLINPAVSAKNLFIAKGSL